MLITPLSPWRGAGVVASCGVGYGQLWGRLWPVVGGLCPLIAARYITTNAQTIPTRNPATTCQSECWRSIMRLVPTSPPTINTKQSHHTGLNMKRKAKAIKPPATPPMAAECVEIFHQTLISAQTTCTTRAATNMRAMKRGICNTDMR